MGIESGRGGGEHFVNKQHQEEAAKRDQKKKQRQQATDFAQRVAASAKHAQPEPGVDFYDVGPDLDELHAMSRPVHTPAAEEVVAQEPEIENKVSSEEAPLIGDVDHQFDPRTADLSWMNEPLTVPTSEPMKFRAHEAATDSDESMPAGYHGAVEGGAPIEVGAKPLTREQLIENLNLVMGMAGSDDIGTLDAFINELDEIRDSVDDQFENDKDRQDFLNKLDVEQNKAELKFDRALMIKAAAEVYQQLGGKSDEWVNNAVAKEPSLADFMANMEAAGGDAETYVDEAAGKLSEDNQGRFYAALTPWLKSLNKTLSELPDEDTEADKKGPEKAELNWEDAVGKFDSYLANFKKELEQLYRLEVISAKDAVDLNKKVHDLRNDAHLNKLLTDLANRTNDKDDAKSVIDIIASYQVQLEDALSGPRGEVAHHKEVLQNYKEWALNDLEGQARRVYERASKLDPNRISDASVKDRIIRVQEMAEQFTTKPKDFVHSMLGPDDLGGPKEVNAKLLECYKRLHEEDDELDQLERDIAAYESKEAGDRNLQEEIDAALPTVGGFVVRLRNEIKALPPSVADHRLKAELDRLKDLGNSIDASPDKYAKNELDIPHLKVVEDVKNKVAALQSKYEGLVDQAVQLRFNISVFEKGENDKAFEEVKAEVHKLYALIKSLPAAPTTSPDLIWRFRKLKRIQDLLDSDIDVYVKSQFAFMPDPSAYAANKDMALMAMQTLIDEAKDVQQKISDEKGVKKYTELPPDFKQELKDSQSSLRAMKKDEVDDLFVSAHLDIGPYAEYLRRIDANWIDNQSRYFLDKLNSGVSLDDAKNERLTAANDLLNAIADARIRRDAEAAAGKGPKLTELPPDFKTTLEDSYNEYVSWKADIENLHTEGIISDVDYADYIKNTMPESLDEDFQNYLDKLNSGMAIAEAEKEHQDAMAEYRRLLKEGKEALAARTSGPDKWLNEFGRTREAEMREQATKLYDAAVQIEGWFLKSKVGWVRDFDDIRDHLDEIKGGQDAYLNLLTIKFNGPDAGDKVKEYLVNRTATAESLLRYQDRIRMRAEDAKALLADFDSWKMSVRAPGVFRRLDQFKADSEASLEDYLGDQVQAELPSIVLHNITELRELIERVKPGGVNREVDPPAEPVIRRRLSSEISAPETYFGTAFIISLKINNLPDADPSYTGDDTTLVSQAKLFFSQPGHDAESYVSMLYQPVKKERDRDEKVGKQLNRLREVISNFETAHGAAGESDQERLDAILDREERDLEQVRYDTEAAKQEIGWLWHELNGPARDFAGIAEMDQLRRYTGTIEQRLQQFMDANRDFKTRRNGRGTFSPADEYELTIGTAKGISKSKILALERSQLGSLRNMREMLINYYDRDTGGKFKHLADKIVPGYTSSRAGTARRIMTEGELRDRAAGKDTMRTGISVRQLIEPAKITSDGSMDKETAKRAADPDIRKGVENWAKQQAGSQAEYTQIEGMLSEFKKTTVTETKIRELIRDFNHGKTFDFAPAHQRQGGIDSMADRRYFNCGKADKPIWVEIGRTGRGVMAMQLVGERPASYTNPSDNLKIVDGRYLGREYKINEGEAFNLKALLDTALSDDHKVELYLTDENNNHFRIKQIEGSEEYETTELDDNGRQKVIKRRRPVWRYGIESAEARKAGKGFNNMSFNPQMMTEGVLGGAPIAYVDGEGLVVQSGKIKSVVMVDKASKRMVHEDTIREQLEKITEKERERRKKKQLDDGTPFVEPLESHEVSEFMKAAKHRWEAGPLRRARVG